MKFLFGFAVISAFCLVLLAAATEEKSPKPQYDAKGNLLRYKFKMSKIDISRFCR